jgi:Concanavalin A-like lectin/glucanases superfamily
VSVDFATAGQSRFVSVNPVTFGSQYSLGAWAYAISMGGSNQGTIFAHGPGGTARCFLKFNGTAGSNKIEFVAGRATANGNWEQTTALTPLARWRWWGVTYDGSAAANHPTMYILDQGVWSVLTNGAGLTRTATPSGAQNADNVILRLGNTASLTLQWVGYLAHGFVYNRLLTEAEMRLVADRGPRRLPRNLLVSWPGVRFLAGTVLKDETGVNDGTGSGTGIAIATAEHPPARW